MIGSLQLDDFSPRAGQSSGSLTMLNTEGDIYVGGVPDPGMLGGRYAPSFTGSSMVELDFVLSHISLFRLHFRFGNSSVGLDQVRQPNREEGV